MQDEDIKMKINDEKKNKKKYCLENLAYLILKDVSKRNLYFIKTLPELHDVILSAFLSVHQKYMRMALCLSVKR